MESQENPEKQEREIVDLFLSSISQFINFFGINESVAKIWITIMLSKEPIGQKEIAEKTGFSLSLISPALRQLEHQGLIEKATTGGKNKKYVVSKTLSESFLMILLHYHLSHVQELESKLKELLKNKQYDNKREELEKLTKEIESLKKLIERITK